MNQRELLTLRIGDLRIILGTRRKVGQRRTVDKIDRITPVNAGWHENGCLYQNTLKTLFCDKCEKIKSKK